jgi:hypothetical protein
MSKLRINKLGSVFFFSVLTVFSLFVTAVTVDIVSYPSILLNSILILSSGLFVSYTAGLVSAPSLFWALITYPMLVPLLADHIFDVPHYSLRGMAYAEPNIIRKGLFLASVFVWIFAATIMIAPTIERDSKSVPTTFLYERQIPFSKIGFAVLSVVVLISAYLTTPGPTILSVSYSVIINNYFSWATFAGSLFMGAWVIFFFSYLNSPRSQIISGLFVIVTISSVLWLILHARRNESIGVLFVLFIVYGNHFRIAEIVSSVKNVLFLGISIFAVAIQILVGEFRSGGSTTDISLRSLFVSNSRHGEYIHTPGGGHNIFSTYQYTLHHVTDSGYYFGETFYRYPIQIIPTPILSLFSIDTPPIYNNYMDLQWQTYPGGNYLLNEYVLNFGMVGVVVAGFIFGIVALYIQEELVSTKTPTLSTALSAGVVIVATRAIWYHQANFANSLQGVLVAYVIYMSVVTYTVFSQKISRQLSDSQMT